jgi:hypothetical protein
MKEVRYSYFVGWAYKVKGYDRFSVGNSVVPVDTRIVTHDQILRLEEAIRLTAKSVNGIEIADVCITSISYLGEVEE